MARAKKAKKNKEFDLKLFIIKELRRAFKRSPMFSNAKNAAKEEFFIQSKNGKSLRRVRFVCAKCKRRFVDKAGAREIAVDHIQPVIDPDVGFVDYNTLIERMFCDLSNLQVLCNYAGERDGLKSCHRIKTNEERRRLNETKRRKKEQLCQ